MNNNYQKTDTHPKKPWRLGFLQWALLFSLLLHFSGLISLRYYDGQHKQETKTQAPIKMKIVQMSRDDLLNKRVIEAPQEQTKEPETYDYLGEKDHIAKKNTKVVVTPRQKALNPSLSAGDKIRKEKARKSTKTAREKPSFFMPGGRNSYEEFLNQSLDHLAQSPSGGFVDNVDQNAEVGDSIDLNTKEFRYIGYFTALRKAIELVWIYPLEAAQKGIQGKVRVKFTILRSGKVVNIAVLNSSGHHLLDQAILDAITMAAPFSPLPEGFHKERLTITGVFSYILSSYANSY